MVGILLSILCVLLILIIIGLYYVLKFVILHPDTFDVPVILSYCDTCNNGSATQGLMVYIGDGIFINQLQSSSTSQVPAFVIITYKGKTYLAAAQYDNVAKQISIPPTFVILIDCSTIPTYNPKNTQINNEMTKFVGALTITINPLTYSQFSKQGQSTTTLTFSSIGKCASVISPQNFLT